ncbi:RNA recognition motif domain-containing protein [Marinomonas ostreistagni]|uniref:RNA recognition motif domain-containing protein n=1 Tax=Marinomonas ostreistagni TaxID=359209 RepID=UPI00194FBCFF|nr:RNA-binding protein [Marinomonas ostreistagni]MBM6550161.1 RNA-binding protein [Marinomonas ostreistagni]
MKLLVRNLARTTTEAQILSLFSEYGNVTECTLVLDKETGLSKGFAFVEIPDDKAATQALKALHHANIDDSKIRVKHAQN